MLYVDELAFREMQGIFPLILFHKASESFHCLGTCFFIHSAGIFVTAKHVNRLITKLCIHPGADIIVGTVGKALHPRTAAEVNYELAPSCRLSFKQLDNGDGVGGSDIQKQKKLLISTSQLLIFVANGLKVLLRTFIRMELAPSLKRSPFYT